jgi:hypothetical protein
VIPVSTCSQPWAEESDITDKLDESTKLPVIHADWPVKPEPLTLTLLYPGYHGPPQEKITG